MDQTRPDYGHACSEAGKCFGSWRLVGDPIDVVTGANTDITVDFRLHGPLPIAWKRWYNSARNGVSCSLGWGHSHDYERTLQYDLDGLRSTDPFGAETLFPPLKVGDSAAASGALLRRVATDSYRLTSGGSPALEFEFRRGEELTPLRRLRQGDSTIELRYDGNGRLSEIADSLDNILTVESDRSGRITRLYRYDSGGTQVPLIEYDYDSAGNLSKGRDRYGVLGFWWDAQSRMVRRSDRRGYSFHFSYDEEGRCYHSRGDDGLLEVSLTFEPKSRKTLVRRGDGGEWSYFYNESGTVTRVVDPYGGSTVLALDESGRVTAETDPNGNVTELLYDSTGRHYARRDALGYVLPTREQEPNPPDPLAYKLPTTPYEWEHGRLSAVVDQQVPAFSDPMVADLPRTIVESLGKAGGESSEAGQFDSSEQWHALATTDEQGRPIRHEINGASAQWKYDPNGNLAEHRDRDGSVLRYEYSSWNALREQVDGLGRSTKFAQSCQGLVSRVEDAGGTVTEYGYDLKERLAEIRTDGQVRERYEYDPAGNIVAKITGTGQKLVMWKVARASLDALRVLASGEEHKFEYDERGRLTAAVTPACSSTLTYGPTGLQTSDKRDGVGVEHRFEGWQLQSTTWLDRFRTGYSREENDDLVVTDPTGARHRVRFGDNGLVARYLANGSQEVAWFDGLGRCRFKVLARTREYGRPWVRSYSYSPAGDLIRSDDTIAGVTSYRYDKAHQLAEVVLPDSSTGRFAYDPAGNLVVQPGLSAVQIASGNRLRSANGDRFEYNDRDHIAVREGRSGRTTYEYNDLDMLVRCEINGEAWQAEYDGLCRRISKTWQGQTTKFYWDDFRLGCEVRPDGSVRVYVYEDEVALVPFVFVEYDGVDAEPSSGRRYNVFTDQIGVPIRVEDDAGRLWWSARIDPYGRAEVSPNSRLEMPLRFPGHYFDVETGLHFNRFRYFSPELGRYLQVDPAGQEGGLNLYAYPSDPLTAVDIDGLASRRRTPAPPAARPTGRQASGVPAGTAAGCPVLAAVPAGRGAELAMAGKPSASQHPGNWDLYTNPGHHDPGNLPGRTAPYNPTKSVIPPNHVDLFNNSVRMPDGTRWAVEPGRPPVYHRFQTTEPNVYHWNGASNGQTASGTPRNILPNDVPARAINDERDR